MKITLNDINSLNSALNSWILAHPEAAPIAEAALHMGSGDETLLLLTPDELLGNGTMCGGGPDHPCFDEKVIAFLKSRGVEHVIVGVIDNEGWTLEQLLKDPSIVPDLLICGGAVPIPYEGEVVEDWDKWINRKEMEQVGWADEDMTPAMVLSMMIDKRSGSWRPDCCSVKGWSTYESE